MNQQESTLPSPGTRVTTPHQDYIVDSITHDPEDVDGPIAELRTEGSSQTLYRLRIDSCGPLVEYHRPDPDNDQRTWVSRGRQLDWDTDN